MIPRKKYRLIIHPRSQYKDDLMKVRKLWGQMLCVYCRQPCGDSVLFPVVLAHRLGFVCKECAKKYLL